MGSVNEMPYEMPIGIPSMTPVVDPPVTEAIVTLGYD